VPNISYLAFKLWEEIEVADGQTYVTHYPDACTWQNFSVMKNLMFSGILTTLSYGKQVFFAVKQYYKSCLGSHPGTGLW